MVEKIHSANHAGSNPAHTTQSATRGLANRNNWQVAFNPMQFSMGYFIVVMAKKKESEKERIIPSVCYCKNCKNGGEIEDFKVMCKIKKIWQHSPAKCEYYEERI